MNVIRISISMLPVVAAKLALLARRRECPASQILSELIRLEWSKESNRNPIRVDESGALRAYTSGELSRSKFKSLVALCLPSYPNDSDMRQSTLSNTGCDCSTQEPAGRRAMGSRCQKKMAKTTKKNDAQPTKLRRKRKAKP